MEAILADNQEERISRKILHWTGDVFHLLSLGAACAWDSRRRCGEPFCLVRCDDARGGTWSRSACRRRELSWQRWESGWRGWRNGSRSGMSRCAGSLVGTGAGCREAVRNATFIEIVRRHLELHLVAWEDAHPVYPHAPCQMAKQLMILRLVTGHFDAKRGIGITLHHNAGEFDHVLGHREIAGVKSRGILQRELSRLKQ